MATSFDPLETCGPTSRSFTPGQFATKRFTSISGAGSTRLYGSKAFDASLQLSFLLSSADTFAFIKCWDDAYGEFDVIDLPFVFWAGSGPFLDDAVPDYLNWRWDGPPSVESIIPGRNRVQIKLKATLDS